ncbi:MAG TPA: 2TM domain-containing protein [Flavisolibacter sp.]|nr:2TM domain-containing protein [Flavisolibacter sp.]
MSYYQTTPEGRDPHLWRIAQARASFKRNLAAYLVMSVVFWVIWYMTGGRNYDGGLPWPIWPMFGWGIGVLFHYLGAYQTSKNNPVEKEYEKLIQNQNK